MSLRGEDMLICLILAIDENYYALTLFALILSHPTFCHYPISDSGGERVQI